MLTQAAVMSSAAASTDVMPPRRVFCRLDNVMEHWSCNADVADSKKRVLIDAVPQFKLFDFGTAVVYGGKNRWEGCHRRKLC